MKGYITITQTATSTPFDNATNGFTSTDVQSAIEESSHKLSSFEATATASASAPTGADTLIAGMTLTPVAGTYIAWFSCDINSAVAGAVITASLYVGGVQSATSQRKVEPFSGGTLTTGSARGALALQGTVTTTAGQAIEVRWSTSNAGPTAANRALTILRVN